MSGNRLPLIIEEGPTGLLITCRCGRAGVGVDLPTMSAAAGDRPALLLLVTAGSLLAEIAAHAALCHEGQAAEDVARLEEERLRPTPRSPR